jgi:archaellum biogenesis ATPase FlaH
MDFLKIILDVGFPIAAALACGFFVFLTLKFILASVTSDVKKLSGIIESLDNRVKTMNADVIRIDTLVSSTLNIRPDLDRIGRADGKADARKD